MEADLRPKFSEGSDFVKLGCGASQRKREEGSSPEFALDGQLGTVALGDPLCKREAEAGAAGILVAGLPCSIEPVEDPRQMFRSDPDSGVGDREPD